MTERHNPFAGVTDLFSELSRGRTLGVRGGPAVVAVEPIERTHASAWLPVTDILAVGDDLVIRVELPGIDPANVELHYTRGVLTVSGTRPSEGTDDPDVVFYVQERYHGEFRRLIALPEGTRAEQLHADFDNGVVEVTVRGAALEDGGTRIELAHREPGTRPELPLQEG